MRYQTQPGSRSFIGLSVFALNLGGCHVTPFAPLPLPPSAPVVDIQPCYERQQIHDLYAPPCRRAAK